ncbi:MAG TPA: Lrp/AsnC family transcriptional regulator [Dehalococcoidia bacterium]|nr:Lrp/AsnC family transcriptional regulator [Dehalococcoidia bacterium]
MPLDELDKKLLNTAQGDFPLGREPFSAIGLQLGVGGDEVLRRLERLKGEGIIRHIGPILDARRLGYQSTLVAMQLPESRLDQAAQVINQHPGVSHNYARDHRFNLWFTLALPRDADLQGELQKLGHLVAAEAVLNLPALRVFKIGSYFDVAGEGRIIAGDSADDSGALPEKMELSPAERAIINELQQDLPLIPRPFDLMAQRLGMDTAEFLELCRSLLHRGIMRRFGASIKHDRVGFLANAMACWTAPMALVNLAGRRLAALLEVSHCYERQTSPLWPYNLFAMIHGHSPGACREVADKVSRETGLDECQLLFSVKEFKKARVRYMV